MKITIFTLCDTAQDFGGKLNIIGTFDTIYSEGFPALFPSFFVVVKVFVDSHQERTYKMKLEMKSPGGKITIIQVADVLLRPRQISMDPAIQALVNLQQTSFEAPGVYKISLFVDDVYVGDCHFEIIKGQP